MGQGTNKDNEYNIKEVGEQASEPGRGSNKSGSASNTTAKGTAGRGHTAGSGTDPGASTTENKKEELSGLSILDEKEKKRLERNAKRRERYQQQKANGELPAQKKPKKVNKTKKKENEIDTSQLNVIIKTISTLIASRPNQEHWLLSDSEIESITVPLTKMMQESAVFEKLGEHSNQIALVTACVTVFMPRIITSSMKIKEKKKNERAKQQPRSQTKVINIDRGNDKGTSNDGKNNGTDEQWINSIVY